MEQYSIEDVYCDVVYPRIDRMILSVMEKQRKQSKLPNFLGCPIV